MHSEFQFVPLEVEQEKSPEITREETIEEEFVLQIPYLDIHSSIKEKLKQFYNNNKIPHIIFHGPSGGGKFTLVNEFINMIYQNDKSKIKSNVMLVNCSHGKGIKFIRDELKFFAKTNIQSNSGILFKTILLVNAHHLTIDAQSALRRCIELFSYNTRFFIIVENKNKLLNPILSRFCEIYVPEYRVDNKVINLHQYVLNHKISDCTQKHEHETIIADRLLSKPKFTHEELADISNEFYDLGISCLDLMGWIVTSGKWTQNQISQVNMCFHKIKEEFRCEKLLMFYILDFVFLSDYKIPNI